MESQAAGWLQANRLRSPPAWTEIRAEVRELVPAQQRQTLHERLRQEPRGGAHLQSKQLHSLIDSLELLMPADLGGKGVDSTIGQSRHQRVHVLFQRGGWLGPALGQGRLQLMRRTDLNLDELLVDPDQHPYDKTAQPKQQSDG